MTIRERVKNNSGLVKAFRSYQKRYLRVGKKPNLTPLLPEIVYRTMRLEGESITRREAQKLFE